jgi:alpha-tubulin suppressor-like RCC1 family protein
MNTVLGNGSIYGNGTFYFGSSGYVPAPAPAPSPAPAPAPAPSPSSSNNIYFWGSNAKGQLGNGVTSQYLPVTNVSTIPVNNVVDVAVCDNGTIALDKYGNVWFCGNDNNGQYGDVTNGSIQNGGYIPWSKINGLYNIVKIAMSTYGCLALDTTGNVWFWGNNINGQLGNINNAANSSNTYYAPTKISGLFNITQIDMGLYGCLALDAFNNIWFWGNDTNGQLGQTNLSGTTRTDNASTNCFVPIVVNLGGVTNSIVSIAISTYGCLALDSTGLVYFWGSNTNGQLGNSTSSSTCYPLSNITGLSNISKISISVNGCLALDTNGVVWFWGNNVNAQLGDTNGGSANYFSPTNISNFATVSQISIGYYGCLALDNTGGVWFWGNDFNGQYGDQNSGSNTYLQPSTISGLSSVTNVKIATNVCYAFPITTSNLSFASISNPRNISFWGDNLNGQLGNGFGNIINYCKPTLPSIPVSNLVDIKLTGNNAIALDSSGNVWFAGNNTYGQYGDGNSGTSSYKVWGIISGLSNIVQIAINRYGCLALDRYGYVWFWGNNINGQCGNISGSNSTNAYYTPTQISGLSNITKISIGQYGCIALDSFGNLWFWGNNTYGQLGKGSGSNICYYPSLIPLNGLFNIKSILIEQYGCLALDGNGNVWFWGNNINAQSGSGTNSSSSYLTITQISGLSNITQISTGAYGCLALNSSGNVYFWGNNFTGQFGDANGNTNSYLAVTQISSLSNIKQVVIQTNACLALNTSGTVYFWGYDLYGQMGTGTNIASYYAPTAVSGVSTSVTNLTVGTYSCIAFTALTTNSITNKNIYFWGLNDFAQYGNATIDNVVYSPNIWSTLPSNVTSVNTYACGHYVSAIVDQSGNVWVAGNNTQAQINVSANASNNYGWTQITGLSNIIKVCVSSNAGCLALSSSGAVSFWGNDVFGQAGDISGNNNTPRYLSVTSVQSSGLPNNIVNIYTGTGSKGCFAQDSSGNLWFWGNNQSALLGNGSSGGTNYCYKPRKASLGSLTNIVTISMSSTISLGLDVSGKVWYWGSNANGMFGTGSASATTYAAPTKMTTLSNIVNITACNYSCLALDKTGNIWFWGNTIYGQFNDTNGATGTTSYLTPTVITAFSNIKQISNSTIGCLALDGSGAVWFWGTNTYGQDGNGAVGNIITKTKVPNLPNTITQFSIGPETCNAI